MPYDQQIQQIARRRALAQALMQQGLQPQGQMAGRIFVPPSVLSTAASLGSVLGGGLLNNKLDTQETQAKDAERQRLAGILQGMLGGGQPGATPTETTQQPTGATTTFGQAPAAPTVDPQQQAMLGIINSLPIEAQQQMVAGTALNRLFPKPMEPFKLAKGEKQFDANGKVIAEGMADAPTTDDIKEWEAAGKPGTLQDWILAQKRAGATSVNVNTEKSLYGTLADKQAGQYSELYGQAQKAPELLQRAQRVKQLLGPNNEAITGAGANWLLAGAKIANQLGFNTGNAAADTESLARELGASTLDAIKASGLGSGSGFSNADRDFLEKVAGGKITLEADSLRRLADLNERSSLGTIQKWNATAGRLDPQQLKTLGMAPIDMPAGTPAPGARPKLTKNSDGSYTYTP